ncbi:GNAT family N-acetyltransferase [Massilia sp. W12]|uniref:GNAT family N-acetyltransferase n=1 Tax=Massilia sp. W12 TaxID=3126507 RepID=UPI0030CA8D34
MEHTSTASLPLAQRFAAAARLRRQLRSPSGLQFAIADALCMLNAAQWDAVTAEAGFFMQRDYLQMMEQAGPDNITPRYCLIYDGQQAVAALYMQIANVSARQLGPNRKQEKEDKANKEEGGKEEKRGKRERALALLKRAIDPAAASLQAGLRERILVCGNLLSYGLHGIAFAPGAAPADIWPAIAEALYRVRRAEKLSGQTDFVMIKDVTPEALPASQIMQKLSYAALETEPNMVLQLDPAWRNHADYLASMQSKYRSAVKQQIYKPINEAGIEIAHLQDINAAAAELHALYLQVHEQASLRLFTLPEVYFPALLHVAGADARCTVARKEGRILGFIITLKDGDTAYGYHIGFDKSVRLPLYLRLLHAAVEDAIAFGCRRLSLGRTALEPKARLGCQPEEITVWVRHRQPVMNIFVRNLLRAVSHDEAPQAHPFKK